MVRISCGHDELVKIELYIDEKACTLIESSAESIGEYSLSLGCHHIKIVQKNPLNHKTWPLYWALPFRFIRCALFYPEGLMGPLYDSNCASIEFDLCVEEKDEDLRFKLIDTKSENNKFSYFIFHPQKTLSSNVSNVERDCINKVFLRRWRMARLIPTFVFTVVLLAISFRLEFSTVVFYLITGAYTVLAFINMIFVFKAKSVNTILKGTETRHKGM